MDLVGLPLPRLLSVVQVFRERTCKTTEDADTLRRWLEEPEPVPTAETWGMTAEAEVGQRGLMGV